MSNGFMMDQYKEQIGCFGKIRSCGDFISRHVSQNVQHQFDQWLEAGLTETKNKFQQQWLDYYLTSPVWYFIRPGANSEQLIFGIMMPSVDKVGRYYPLIVVKELHCYEELDLGQAAKLEDLMLDTLISSVGVDELDQQLQMLDQGLTQGAGISSRNIVDLEAQSQQQLCDFINTKLLRIHPDDTESATNIFVHSNEMGQQHKSIWWTKGSDRIEKTALVCCDFPPIGGIHATLDGDWPGAGWEPLVQNNDEWKQKEKKQLMEECCD